MTATTEVLESIGDVRAWRGAVASGADAQIVGFVPTMGALHEGHRSLMRAARAVCDRTVVSVFVNPTQFGPTEDFEVYPRDREGDLAVCGAEGVDAVWFGHQAELYPAGFATEVALPKLAHGLCGRSRPGHFPGVALIVLKLFQVVRPQRAFFGLKDYQQFVLLRQMSRDLHLDVDVVGCPIVREANGLALSSRNQRLSDSGREAAQTLSRALEAIRSRYKAGERHVGALLREAIELVVAAPDVKLEYLEVVDPSSLEPLQEIPAEACLDAASEAPVSGAAVAAIAAHVDGVRLIDNVVLTESAQ